MFIKQEKNTDMPYRHMYMYIHTFLHMISEPVKCVEGCP